MDPYYTLYLRLFKCERTVLSYIVITSLVNSVRVASLSSWLTVYLFVWCLGNVAYQKVDTNTHYYCNLIS